MKTMILRSLQTTRFFASLGVAQYHLWQNYFGVRIGHPGTDIFLVLVGLVAAYSQAKHIAHGRWWDYLRARYLRLYVTFLPLFLIALLVKWDEADLDWALRSFFFIPIPDESPVIGATWMLSMFVLFYFVFSLCFVVRTERILLLLFGVWATLILARKLFEWESGLADHWERLFLTDRNLDFMMGYGAGTILRHGFLDDRYARILCWTGFTGVVFGTILLNLGLALDERAAIVGLPIVLFILGLAALEQNGAGDRIVRFFTMPWLVWLGGTSYVLYLSHGLFFHAWNQFLPVTLGTVLLITLGSVLTAAIGYTFWEFPVLGYLRNGIWRLPTGRATGRW